MNLFSKSLLVYIPAYNCVDTIVDVIRGIPPDVKELADILVVDNGSKDGTVARFHSARNEGLIPKSCVLVETARNLGYAGSQKLAYKLALLSPSVEWVIMLHGDGQYPPELTKLYLPYLKTETSVCYGYRSKSHYPQEETPWSTWFVIRVLSLIESVVTRVYRKEWHTGFVMYRTSFLKRVALDRLTSTPHIDGNLLFASGVMGVVVQAIPIFKKYKDLTAFEGAARRTYVLDVFRLMFEFRRNRLSYLNGASTALAMPIMEEVIHDVKDLMLEPKGHS